MIRNAIDPQAELGVGERPYKTDRIDNAVVDISKLQNHTGYQPKISFEEGIAATIAYFKEERARNA